MEAREEVRTSGGRGDAGKGEVVLRRLRFRAFRRWFIKRRSGTEREKVVMMRTVPYA